MSWIKRMRRRWFGMSPDVAAAVKDSTQRAEDARAARIEVEQNMKPIRQALRQNGFEPAVLATFRRRNA